MKIFAAYGPLKYLCKSLAVIKLCYYHITRFWVALAWRPETDVILQQDLLLPHELRKPNHSSGLALMIKKVQLHHTHQKKDDMISRRAPDVWREDQNAISIVFNPFTV